MFFFWVFCISGRLFFSPALAAPEPCWGPVIPPGAGPARAWKGSLAASPEPSDAGSLAALLLGWERGQAG